MENRFRILEDGGEIECSLGTLVEDFLQDTPESGMIEDLDERVLNQQRLLSEIVEVLYKNNLINVDWINNNLKKEGVAEILKADSNHNREVL